MKEADRVGQVQIVSMDRGNDVLQMIGDGVIQATIAQQTALMPWYALHILYSMANHDLPISSDNRAASVRPDIAERVMGHAIGGVEAIYDRHGYELEKADALAKLAKLIALILNPPAENVVPIGAVQ